MIEQLLCSSFGGQNWLQSPIWYWAFGRKTTVHHLKHKQQTTSSATFSLHQASITYTDGQRRHHPQLPSSNRYAIAASASQPPSQVSSRPGSVTQDADGDGPRNSITGAYAAYGSPSVIGHRSPPSAQLHRRFRDLRIAVLLVGPPVLPLDAQIFRLVWRPRFSSKAFESERIGLWTRWVKSLAATIDSARRPLILSA